MSEKYVYVLEKVTDSGINIERKMVSTYTDLGKLMTRLKKKHPWEKIEWFTSKEPLQGSVSCILSNCLQAKNYTPNAPEKVHYIVSTWEIK